MKLLQAVDLEFGYSRNTKILDGISFDFEPGKVYAILGPSGCGKTTLLYILGGLQRPDRGQVFYQGKDIKEIGYGKYRHDNVAFVFQNYNLIPYMTAIENVKLTAESSPKKMLEKVKLTEKEMRRQVRKLSGGQQQRVAVARALASGAPVILADEPTGNLDEKTAEEVADLLIDNAAEPGRCVVIVTHSGKLAEKADEVIRLSKGKISVERSRLI